jgi:uncharacterized protein YndB with AHSA1/START domain
MLKKVLIILGVLAALTLLMAAVGFSLPREHRATSTIVLQAPPEQVWDLVRNPGALQGTWSELESARRLPDRDGKELWEQRAGGFDMRLIVEEAVPSTRLVTRIDAEEDAVFGGTWTYELSTEGGDTRLSVTENGWVGNPLFRVMMHAMGIHRTLDGYLAALATKLGEDTRPAHVP